MVTVLKATLPGGSVAVVSAFAVEVVLLMFKRNTTGFANPGDSNRYAFALLSHSIVTVGLLCVGVNLRTRVNVWSGATS